MPYALDPELLQAVTAMLALTGTSIELHVHPGCPHGFDRLPPRPTSRAAPGPTACAP